MPTAGALNNATVTDNFTDDEGDYLFAEIVLGAGSYTLNSLHFYAGDRNSGGGFNDARLAVFSGSTAATATKVFQTPHYNSSNPFGSTTPAWRTVTAAGEAFSGPNVYIGFVSDDGINMTGVNGADAGGITDTSNYWKTTAASGAPSGEFPTSLPDNGAAGALSPIKAYIDYTVAGGEAALSQTLAAVTASSAATLELSGTLSGTLAAATLSSTGQIELSGTLTGTLGSVTLSSGAVLALDGALTVTLANATLSAEGGSANTATLTATLDSLSLSSDSVLALIGQSTPTLDALASSSASALDIAGALSQTLAALSLAATGGAGAAGEASVTLGGLSLSAESQLALAAALAESLADVQATAVGDLTIAGLLSSTLGLLSVSANGVAVDPIVGTLTVTLSDAELAAVGTSGVIEIDQARLVVVLSAARTVTLPGAARTVTLH